MANIYNECNTCLIIICCADEKQKIRVIQRFVRIIFFSFFCQFKTHLRVT